MAVNKIVINNEVKLDLTADTVSPSTLALGITAHDKSGNIITGTMESGGINEEDLKFSGGLNYFGHDGRLDNIIEHNFDKIKKQIKKVAGENYFNEIIENCNSLVHNEE